MVCEQEIMTPRKETWYLNAFWKLLWIVSGFFSVFLFLGSAMIDRAGKTGLFLVALNAALFMPVLYMLCGIYSWWHSFHSRKAMFGAPDTSTQKAEKSSFLKFVVVILLLVQILILVITW